MNKNRYTLIFVITVLMIFQFLSCSGDGTISASEGDVPDTVSENITQVTVSRSGKIVVSCSSMETFAGNDKSVFHNAVVTEYDSEGNKKLSGSAGYIEATGEKSGFGKDSVVLQDYSQDFQLEAEYLEWDNKERKLKGRGPVTIKFGDGLYISGNGFTADAARLEYSYSGGVEGKLELDESKKK